MSDTPRTRLDLFNQLRHKAIASVENIAPSNEDMALDHIDRTMLLLEQFRDLLATSHLRPRCFSFNDIVGYRHETFVIGGGREVGPDIEILIDQADVDSVITRLRQLHERMTTR